MKIFLLLPVVAACALAVSCQKPQTEAERNAQIEREVQQRLAAERQAADQQRLTQQQADLDARERAVAAREATPEKEIEQATPVSEPEVPERSESNAQVSASDEEPANSYDTFYRKLEPYGSWRETSDYGFVWQPRSAQQSRDWRPYTDGRWAYTDAGWTWISGEPFGWATYHYGRWTRLSGVGWVWVPGQEWAPAWVSWREGNQNVGWAPLPPEARFDRGKGIKKWADSYYDIDADEYVFIPNEDIGSENIQRDIIPFDRNVTIVNQTTNVTNITYSNTTIINQGPNFDQLRAHSRRPLERMRLERQYRVDSDRVAPASVNGGVVAMVTPVFNGRATQRPRTEGAPIHDAKVQRNWAKPNDPAEAERARVKMKSEATPPPDAPAKGIERPPVVQPTAAPVASSPSPAPRASITPGPRMTPKPTVPPAASPTPTAAATVSPRATATPRPRATPVITATPMPKPTGTPIPLATPAATPAATAVQPSPRKDRPVTPPIPVPPVKTENNVPVPNTNVMPPNPMPQRTAVDLQRKQIEEKRDARVRELTRPTPPLTPAAAAIPKLPPAGENAPMPNAPVAPKSKAKAAQRGGESKPTPTPPGTNER